MGFRAENHSPGCDSAALYQGGKRSFDLAQGCSGSEVEFAAEWGPKALFNSPRMPEAAIPSVTK
jgi:hypothetical protein